VRAKFFAHTRPGRERSACGRAAKRIVYTADLLEQHREIAEAYGTRFSHLLVDEFQDTNAAQFAIVKTLGEHVTTVSVFADDDQAIYPWGAQTRVG